MSTTTPRGVPPVDLDVAVSTISRPATLILESTPLPEAWGRLHRDDDRCGVVVRDGLPIAVVSAGGLAERWPTGGPLTQYRCTVHDALEHPCGVEILGGDEPLEHAGHRLLASGLPALPVRPGPDRAIQVVTAAGLLGALLGAGTRP